MKQKIRLRKPSERIAVCPPFFLPNERRTDDTAGAGDRADRYGQENIAIPTDDTSNWCYDNRSYGRRTNYEGRDRSAA